VGLDSGKDPSCVPGVDVALLPATQPEDDRDRDLKAGFHGAGAGQDGLLRSHTLVVQFQYLLAAALQADVEQREACLADPFQILVRLAEDVGGTGVNTDPFQGGEELVGLTADLLQRGRTHDHGVRVQQEDPPYARPRLATGLLEILHYFFGRPNPKLLLGQFAIEQPGAAEEAMTLCRARAADRGLDQQAACLGRGSVDGLYVKHLLAPGTGWVRLKASDILEG